MAAAGHDATFSDLAIKIVTSRQFRHRAGDAGRHHRQRTPAPVAADSPSTSVGPFEKRSTQMSIDAQVRNQSRRHFLRGMGVALALPWMGRCRCSARRRR